MTSAQRRVALLLVIGVISVVLVVIVGGRLTVQPAYPPTHDLVDALAETGATDIRVISDETKGEGLLTQTRVVRFEVDANSRQVQILFQRLPWVARMTGSEEPDAEAIRADQSSQIGGVQVLTRQAKQLEQAVAVCHGLVINVTHEGVSDGSERPARSLISDLLDILNCA
jgi:hypothetical protein